MKLSTQLAVNDEPVQLVKWQTRLALGRVGRAQFEVNSTEPLSGLVRFSFGWNNQVEPYFIGLIRNASATSTGSQLLDVFELSVLLESEAPLALRHCTISQVCQALADATELRFLVAEGAYTQIRQPYFYTTGPGIHGLRTINLAFNQPRFIWQCLPDGQIWCGNWEDSRWAARAIDVPQKVLKPIGSNSAIIPPVPKLRPGALVNGQYLQEVNLKSNDMEITWSRQLNAWC